MVAFIQNNLLNPWESLFIYLFFNGKYSYCK